MSSAATPDYGGTASSTLTQSSPAIDRAPAEMPPSCTRMAINLVGALALISGLILLCYYDQASLLCTRTLGVALPEASDVFAGALAIGCYAIPIIALEFVFLRPQRNESAGLDFSRPQPFNLGRVILKLLGFYATLLLVFVLYWAFPEYSFSQRSFYDPYWRFLRLLLPALLIGAVPYIAIVDRYMKDPRDHYWYFGFACMSLFTGRFGRIDYQRVGQHLLGWLVKAFFLALMYVYMHNDIAQLRAQFHRPDLLPTFSSFTSFYAFAYRAIFMLDVVMAATGYLLTLRIFDSHIRSAEPTLLGWMVTIVCYEPFWSFAHRSYLNYDQQTIHWDRLWGGHPTIQVLWGATILALLLVYVLSTVPFGIRFSNLTHRGILTNGPYRFCKHPAYVSKNLSWWLISVPFISSASPSDAIRRCLLLLGLNAVYYLRARTEERHLSKDSKYVQYALVMNEKSMFAGLGRLIPALRYRPPAVES